MKIESNIPAPKDPGRGRPHKYPWNRMEVGDSLFIPDVLHMQIGPAASQRGKRYNEKYSCRTEGDGVRVWRIA